MRSELLLLIIILTMSSIYGKAQESNPSSKFSPDKLIFGGDIGFAISNSDWSVGISPQIGYKLTDSFHVGTGFSYIHGQSKDNDYYSYKENSIGLNLFAHYYPWKKLMFRIKPEIMHNWYRGEFRIDYEDGFENYKYSENKFVPAVIIGGGLHLRPVVLLLNYELVRNRYSSYSDDIFLSVGLMF